MSKQSKTDTIKQKLHATANLYEDLSELFDESLEGLSKGELSNLNDNNKLKLSKILGELRVVKTKSDRIMKLMEQMK